MTAVYAACPSVYIAQVIVLYAGFGAVGFITVFEFERFEKFHRA